MHCRESRMTSRPGSSTQRLNTNLSNYDDHIKYSRSFGILYRQKASSSVSLIFFLPYVYVHVWLFTPTKTFEISRDDNNICQKLIPFIRTKQKCSKLKVSPHFEQLGVMQDSSILRYLCSSCCQKFPWNRRQKSVDTYFSNKLGLGSMCAGKILWGKQYFFFIFLFFQDVDRVLVVW